MSDVLDETQAGTDRRSFITKGIVTAAGATVGAGLLTDISPAIAKDGGLNKETLQFSGSCPRSNKSSRTCGCNTPNSAESKPLPANFLDCPLGAARPTPPP